ncbi:hypothetical protein SDJN02_26156, partial [Cucurbita argyrosperma subsp. argyrosperma]
MSDKLKPEFLHRNITFSMWPNPRMKMEKKLLFFRWDDVKLEMMKKFGSQNAMNSVRVRRFVQLFSLIYDKLIWSSYSQRPNFYTSCITAFVQSGCQRVIYANMTGTGVSDFAVSWLHIQSST